MWVQDWMRYRCVAAVEDAEGTKHRSGIDDIEATAQNGRYELETYGAACRTARRVFPRMPSREARIGAVKRAPEVMMTAVVKSEKQNLSEPGDVAGWGPELGTVLQWKIGRAHV